MSFDIPDATAAQIAFGRLQAMNQMVFETFEREHQPEDQELQAEYQRQIACCPVSSITPITSW